VAALQDGKVREGYRRQVSCFDTDGAEVEVFWARRLPVSGDKPTYSQVGGSLQTLILATLRLSPVPYSSVLRSFRISSSR
jgi:hypothetical protein